MDEKNETDIDEMIITNDIIQDIINIIIYEIENDHPLIRRSKFDDDKIESPRALKFMFVYEAFYKETMTNSTRRKDRKKISRLSVIEQRAQMVERNSQV
jgi:hypothetical protein